MVVLDEMGYTCWPQPAATWAEVGRTPVPMAPRMGTNNQQWRTIGALHAWTGQVHYLDGYIVGRANMIALYHHLAQAYPDAERIYVVQDTWSIHRHADVVAALAMLPRMEPVWLNPIEKLWHWLRQHVLPLHRLAGAWSTLRQRVCTLLAQFAHGSREFLHDAGLLGEGQLAQALHGS